MKWITIISFAAIIQLSFRTVSCQDSRPASRPFSRQTVVSQDDSDNIVAAVALKLMADPAVSQEFIKMKKENKELFARLIEKASKAAVEIVRESQDTNAKSYTNRDKVINKALIPESHSDAEKFMLANGWSRATCGIVTVPRIGDQPQHKLFFVSGIFGRTESTSNLPIFLSDLQEREYWVKRSYSGISALWSGSEEYSFSFATWR